MGGIENGVTGPKTRLGQTRHGGLADGGSGGDEAGSKGDFSWGSGFPQGHGEPVAELQARGILMDGSTANGEKRLLLQIFSQTLLGPVFFEFIQRKADEGFGEGNFKALFESLERDQMRRGALQVDA